MEGDSASKIMTEPTVASDVPRTILICHADDALNREGLARWLAATTNLVGIVVLNEPPKRIKKRIQREIKRVGYFRFLDVLAFRVYYKLFLAGQDHDWEQQTLKRLCDRFPPLNERTGIINASSPNSLEVEKFIRDLRPDLVIARCKSLLKESIFSVATRGTYVMHPGICPQYRNAHGCFWALAKNDRHNVGMTLLKIDRGIDTGPVYGYFRCEFDETRETHHVIQHKVLFNNLDSLQQKLSEIYAGTAKTLDTRGLPSGEWGQPWLTEYLGYLRRAKSSGNR